MQRQNSAAASRLPEGWSIRYTGLMTETVVSIDDAARSLPDLVERLRARGEAAVLVRAGRPLAKIVPVPAVAEDLVAFLRRWRVEYPEADEQFGQVIEESRRGIHTPRDPWE